MESKKAKYTLSPYVLLNEKTNILYLSSNDSTLHINLFNFFSLYYIY